MKAVKFILLWLIALGERGEINPGGPPQEPPDPGAPPTSTEHEHDSEPPSGGGDEGEGEGGAGEPDSTRPATAPQSKDPTLGMTVEQQVAYWKNQYAGTYKRLERLQQKTRSPGLTANVNQNGYRQPPPPAPEKQDITTSDGKPIETIGELEEHILHKAESNFERKFIEKQLDARVASSEEQARQTFNGADGRPPYDELFDEIVAPLIQQNPRVYELLRLCPNPAQAAYTLGYVLKFPANEQRIASEARDDLVKKINKTGRQAATVQGRGSGRPVSTELTKEDIDRMTPEAFEKVLDKFKQQAEGF